MQGLARIKCPPRDVLWREHVLRGEPVIVTDLMQGTPVAAITDRSAAIAALGKMPLTIRPEYSRWLLRSLVEGSAAAQRVETMSLGAYYRHVDSAPGTELMCIEERTPPDLAALAPPPAPCTNHLGQSDPALKSTVFVGNAGNFAPLHYDGDSRHVLLYQVFGEKRFTMIPARQGAALDPIANFSTLMLARASDAQRERLLARLGGWSDVIRPGDTVFMPALAYHAADYLTDGMSVNFRFGRNRYHELLSAHVHLDPHGQRLGAASLSEESVETVHRDRFRRLTEALLRPAPTCHTKYLEMKSVLEEVTDDLGDDPAPVDAVADAPFARLPEVAREALLRAHLFREQLYRHREPLSPDSLGVPTV